MLLAAWSILDQPLLVTDIVYKAHLDLILQWTLSHPWNAPLSLNHPKGHLAKLMTQEHEEIDLG
jgi:hypothetical protein